MSRQQLTFARCYVADVRFCAFGIRSTRPVAGSAGIKMGMQPRSCLNLRLFTISHNLVSPSSVAVTIERHRAMDLDDTPDAKSPGRVHRHFSWPYQLLRKPLCPRYA